MVDNLKLEYLGDIFRVKKQHELQDFLGLTFFPQYNKEGIYTSHTAILSKEGTFVLKIYKTGLLTIENSLHKFWKGNNLTDFTLSEIQESVNWIEDELKISSCELKFRRTELGWNIINEFQFFENFSQYKMNDYDKMKNGKINYGRKFYLTDFNLKGYNKFLETKLNHNPTNDTYLNVVNKNLNRLEIEFKRMRELNNIGFVTLADITKKETMQLATDITLRKFECIEMLKNYDYSVLNSRDRELIFAGQSSDFWILEKNNNYNTYKKKRAKYKDCIKRLDTTLQEDPKTTMLNELFEKTSYLLSN